MYRRQISILLYCFLFCSSIIAQSSLENRNHASKTDLVYDYKAWRFDAQGPVRATPWVEGNDLYVGSAGGDFYCLDRKTGKLNWKYHTGSAIHSTATGTRNFVFFSDNHQTVYGFSRNGQLRWKFSMAKKLDYPWRFDYYYSSPCLAGNALLIGGDDGFLYKLDQSTGKLLWKFKAHGLVRGTPSISGQHAYVGDNDGHFYCLNLADGKQLWEYKVIGEPFDLDTFGFDRKAILGAAVISQGKILFGSRDGYLYALNMVGTLSWTMNHHVSWVISTVAISDSMVVTGTSDGRFVQAIDIQSGKELWKQVLPMATWSSPLINNKRLYDGCFDGQVFCLDLSTGKRISRFSSGAMVLSSPVIADSLLYFGSDDGYLYALKGRPPVSTVMDKRFVYYDAAPLKLYFKDGADLRIRNYLQGEGFQSIGTDTLASVMAEPSGTVIVLATTYFPASVLRGGSNSQLRQFLDNGGRIVLPGSNSMFYELDEKGQQILGFGRRQVDTVLSLNYGVPDTRSFGGVFPAFANEKGRQFGLPEFWTAFFGIDQTQVDIVLGENENGQASAFIKKYKNGGKLVQLWMHPSIPQQMDAIVKLAESDLDHL